jgi:hypothetical protein
MSRDTLAQAVLGSAEATNDRVAAYYGELLKRGASPTEIAAFAAYLEGGESDAWAIAVMAGSDEYFSLAP